MQIPCRDAGSALQDLTGVRVEMMVSGTKRNPTFPDAQRWAALVKTAGAKQD